MDVPQNNDCKEQIDSTNQFWKAVIKNLVIVDTVSQTKDSINWIDSLRIKDSTSIRWIDSLVIRDSVKIRDSVVSVLRESYKIPVIRIEVDDSVSGLGKENLIDNILYNSRQDKGTRWAVSGYPHQVMLYFDTVYVVTEVWLNVYGWNENYTHTLNIYTYGDKIKNITTLPTLWSKHSILAVGSHIYLDILSGKNSWTDIAEIKLFGYIK